jgi:hypothetical protein
MTKPIGYFCSHTPGDGTVFDKLENRFGSQLEEMGQEEKYFLLAAILFWLGDTDEKQMTAAVEECPLTECARRMEAAFSDELWAMLPEIQELRVSDLLGLCEAMLGQAKEALRVRFAELRELQRSYQGALESQGVPSPLAEQAAGILAYEAKNSGYQRTPEEKLLISALWRYTNKEVVR